MDKKDTVVMELRKSIEIYLRNKDVGEKGKGPGYMISIPRPGKDISREPISLVVETS